MIGLLRLIIFGLIAMTVVYWALSVYSRSVRREKLEKRWAEEHPDDVGSPARTAYIEDGMAKYESGLRKKLIWLVYVIPTALVIAILFVTNTN